MTVLIDTGVLYADHDTDATRHEPAATALETVYNGEYGQPYISDYIYDEAVTLTATRGGTTDPAIQLGQRLRGVDPYPNVYEQLTISTTDFNTAVDIFEHYDDHGLSFTDATNIALVERHDIDTLLSFDDDFDGLISRLDPTTLSR
ncbi:type II toxin-antitoxin system VapC family toxin [Salarchaeum sp. III]|uniref:type II toxin-antitoxin system VapC family toxin n=1 Tax=Salarchaeum sp. III TaxID=3107927 RepID=UPI002ED7AAB8